jgi:serine/threonine protein kinase
MFYDRFTRQLWLLGLTLDRDEVMPSESRQPRSSTLSYCAPELFGDTTADERSDIYAAGVAVYHLVTDHYPYGRIRARSDWNDTRGYTPLRRHNEALPNELDDILERACAADPARRFNSAAQFAAALSAVCARSAADDASEPSHAGANASRAHSRVNTNGGTTRWPWWLVATLAIGLIAYLSFTLS